LQRLKDYIMQWKIEYWSNSTTGNSPIEKWLNKLPEEQFDAIFKEVRQLKSLGNAITLPHSKALAKGLFELRDREFGLRIYYAFHGKALIILLAAGNKTSQEQDITIARKRLAMIKKDNK
jgi:putative addiction module killer protein